MIFVNEFIIENSQIQRDIYTVEILNLLSFQQVTNTTLLYLFSKHSEKIRSIDFISDKNFMLKKSTCVSFASLEFN